MSDSSAQEPPSADIPQQDSDSKSEQGLATRIKGKLGMRPKSPTDKKASRKKNKNVWIFAGDMQDNMYVGMKVCFSPVLEISSRMTDNGSANRTFSAQQFPLRFESKDRWAAQGDIRAKSYLH